MRCRFSAHTRLFFSCQTSLTHPAHFQPSTRCFENVSDLLPNYADNIRTPHVYLTRSGLNYFYALPNKFHLLLWVGLDQKSFLFTCECEADGQTTQTAAFLRDVQIQLTDGTCHALHSLYAAANQLHHKNIKLNARDVQNFNSSTEPRHRNTVQHRSSLSSACAGIYM